MDSVIYSKSKIFIGIFCKSELIKEKLVLPLFYCPTCFYDFVVTILNKGAEELTW